MISQHLETRVPVLSLWKPQEKLIAITGFIATVLMNVKRSSFGARWFIF
jgi:hypothetical protein